MSNSTTMLGRNFKHTVRNPVAVFNAILTGPRLVVQLL